MEIIVKIAWFALILVHMPPALVLFQPQLIETLYGVSPGGDLGVLLAHRGALFLAVIAVAGFALFDSDGRRVASLVVAISMIGFLWLYVRAGMPSGALRKIAVSDFVALLPLTFVLFEAWRSHAA